MSRYLFPLSFLTPCLGMFVALYLDPAKGATLDWMSSWPMVVGLVIGVLLFVIWMIAAPQKIEE